MLNRFRGERLPMPLNQIGVQEVTTNDRKHQAHNDINSIATPLLKADHPNQDNQRPYDNKRSQHLIKCKDNQLQIHTDP